MFVTVVLGTNLPVTLRILTVMVKATHAPLLFFALAVVAATVDARQQERSGGKRVMAGQAAGQIRVDGVLDEPEWQSAGVIAQLEQQAPNPGAPTVFPTQVRVMVSGDALYFAFECSDPAPGSIAARTLQRDGSFGGDDHVGIVLDTFGEGIGGYFFRVNAGGARQDGLIISTEYSSLEWDGIWEARTRTSRRGWVAEIAIPSQSLRFRRGAERWGLNVERFVARERLTLRWSGVSLDALLTDLRRAGELGGVGELRQGRGLSVSPYGLVRSESDLLADRSSTTGDGGVDVSYNLGSELAAVFTVNTDFAETDVDTRQVNLTRFSLFFPEKRQFFTDGSDQFDYGFGNGSQFVPFFSRRMGLYQGQPVPILGGVKLIGRQGRFGIGVIDVQTDDTKLTRGTNLFAARVTYDADEHLRLSAIVTNGDPAGVERNQLGGVDALWQTSTFRGNKNLAAGAWLAGLTGSNLGSGNRTAWGVKLDYPNNLWDVNLVFKEMGDAMTPALGFVPRPGTRWYESDIQYRPRPENGWWASWVRQHFFQLVPRWITGLDGRTQSWSVTVVPLNAEAHSGDNVRVTWTPQLERLDQPFEIVAGVVIPAGSYRFDRYSLAGGTSSHRSWSVGASVSTGTFYTGRLDQVTGSMRYTSGDGHLRLELSAENSVGKLDEGDFVQRVFRLLAFYAFTPDVVVSSYVQYDSASRNLGTNSKLRWTIKPGTDFYVVWNHGWVRSEGEDSWRVLKPASDQAIVKLRYTWRP